MVLIPGPVHACVRHDADVAVKASHRIDVIALFSILKSDCPFFFIILRMLLLSHREVVSHFLVTSKTKQIKKLDYTEVQNNEDYFFY